MSEANKGVLKQETTDKKYKRKAVQEMDTTKLDYIMNIFKTLSTELPDQMLYREDGDSIELKTLDSVENCSTLDMQNNGWLLIGSQVAAAA